MSRLVIYHAQCRDGWAAAWAATKPFSGPVLHAAMYGSEPPDVSGRDVLLVDFCYPRDVLLRMAGDSERIRVLDHHKTAEKELAGLSWATFDMNRSGAGIAWDELVGGARPWLIDYVEDRDLWRWALPNSREVNAFIGTLPYGQPEHGARAGGLGAVRCVMHSENWMGSVFKGPSWVRCGYAQSTHKGGHGRMVSVWRRRFSPCVCGRAR